MYPVRVFLSSFILLFILSACTTNPVSQQTTAEPRSLTVMLINDIYRINGVEGGESGGLARVRTLREELEREDPGLLLLHAGDMLFPSLLSRRYDGEQMIDMLNRLDGVAGAFDGAMFATFGNHEFDKSQMKHAAMLAQRVRDSEFSWLNANVDFKPEAQITAEHLLPSKIIERNGIRIGLFGLTIDSKIPQYVAAIHDPLQRAREMTARLRAEGAELVIALTHLRMQQDMALLRELGAEGPDILFGGHEHHRLVGDVDGRFVFKADADARSALVARIRLRDQGQPEVAYEYRDLSRDVQQEPALQQRIDLWLARHDREYCASIEQPLGCLAEVIGRTRVQLVAEELQIRGQETNLGDWVADRALDAFRDQGAQVAFINSGSLRLNQDLAPETEITRQHLLELFAYPAPLHLIRIDGATLQRVVEQAITDWPGEGRWLQVAGFAWRHQSNDKRADGLTLLTQQGNRLIRPDESILAVVNNFLIDPTIGDQDGYSMLNRKQEVNPDAPPLDLVALVIDALRKAGEEGIAPVVEGRICTLPSERPGPCVAVLPE